MKENADDILLLNLIREGDTLAFRHFFETYFTSLCRFMHMFISDKAVVEELAMDIFVYFWENSKTIGIQYSLKAYLFQAARNKCLNELRLKKKTVPLDDISQDVIDTEVISLENEELYRLIQEAVFALPDKCREVFNLSRNENLSNKEIAEKLDISIKTVEGQITKSLKKIKEFLGDSYIYLF